MSEPTECSCPQIRIGLGLHSELRNLSPDCPIHGGEERRQTDRLFGGEDSDYDWVNGYTNDAGVSVRGHWRKRRAK